MGKGKMMEASRRSVKEAGGERSSSRDKERVGLEENLQFSSGSSHSSSFCKQFSQGNDSFYFYRVVCLMPQELCLAFGHKASLITGVTITTDEADLHRWQHTDVNFASASSTLAVCCTSDALTAYLLGRISENHTSTALRIFCGVNVCSVV